MFVIWCEITLILLVFATCQRHLVATTLAMRLISVLSRTVSRCKMKHSLDGGLNSACTFSSQLILKLFSQSAGRLVSCEVSVSTYLSSSSSSPILDYELWAPSLSRFLGSQPAGDISHKPGGRLPLLSTRTTVTFPTKEITALAGTKLYWLVTEAHMCK